jgi:hypothetical protein
VLDAMSDANVKGLDREMLHEPLLEYLNKLKERSDPYLVYQAAYAYQALLCVPDNEKKWQAGPHRAGKAIEGVSGIVNAEKAFDLVRLIDSLNEIQEGSIGLSDVVAVIKETTENVPPLAKSGKTFMECLTNGFSHKCAWYPALRGADTLIQDGRFAEFTRLICEAPCRTDTAFLWGVCQRLEEIAANPKIDPVARRSAIAFLGEMYRNDAFWGSQEDVKQWILTVLMQLSSRSGREMQCK